MYLINSYRIPSAPRGIRKAKSQANLSSFAAYLSRRRSSRRPTNGTEGNRGDRKCKLEVEVTAWRGNSDGEGGHRSECRCEGEASRSKVTAGHARRSRVSVPSLRVFHLLPAVPFVFRVYTVTTCSVSSVDAPVIL